LINWFNNLIWQRPYEALAKNGDRVARLCLRDSSQDRVIGLTNFWLYLTFLVAIFAYIPSEYPGWLTWVLYLREWLGKGSDSQYMQFTVLFFFHVVPYTIISLSLGYVSIVPGCQLLNVDPEDHAMMELGITRKEILNSLVRITYKVIAKYFFILMIGGIGIRALVVTWQLSTGAVSFDDYGMNPYVGMLADCTCLGLMIFGKIFSSFYCSVKFPKYFPAFLLSIWMTIEYWLLYTIILFLNSRFFMVGLYEANPNTVLYISWIITGVLGTTAAWYWMAKSSVFTRYKELR